MNLTTLKFTLFYLRLRCLQVYRMFAEAGIGYLLVLLFVAWLMGLSFIEKLHSSQHIIWSFVIALPAIGRHFVRKDDLFLKHLTIYKPILYVAEYLLMALPFLLVMAFFQPILNLAFGIFLIVLIAFLPIPKFSEKLSYLNFSWIPLSLFEWKSGMRKNGLSILFLYFITLAFAKFEGAILLFTLFFAIIISSFFNACEPKEWLVRPFLLSEKMVIQLSIWSLILLPHLVLFLYFHFELWYLAAFCWYFGAMVIAFCLAYKYSLWSPFRGDVAIDKASMIFIGMMLIIFTAPACLFAIAYYWRKANRNYQLF